MEPKDNPNLRYPTKYCAQVTYDRVPDWLNLGWLVIADLGPTHGEWSLMMGWLCECECKKAV